MTKRIATEPTTIEILMTYDPARQTISYTRSRPDGIGASKHTIAPDGDEWLLRFNDGNLTVKRHYPTTEAAVAAVVHSFMPVLRPPAQ